MRKKKLRLHWVEQDAVIIPITVRPDDATRTAAKRPLPLSVKSAKAIATSVRRSLSS